MKIYTLYIYSLGKAIHIHTRSVGRAHELARELYSLDTFEQVITLSVVAA